jgi:hypothetical protein
MTDEELRTWAMQYNISGDISDLACNSILRLLDEKKQWQRRAGLVKIPGSFEYHSPYDDAPITDAPKLAPVVGPFTEPDNEGDALMAFFKSTNS